MEQVLGASVVEILTKDWTTIFLSFLPEQEVDLEAQFQLCYSIKFVFENSPPPLKNKTKQNKTTCLLTLIYCCRHPLISTCILMSIFLLYAILVFLF